MTEEAADIAQSRLRAFQALNRTGFPACHLDFIHFDSRSPPSRAGFRRSGRFANRPYEGSSVKKQGGADSPDRN